MDLVLLTTFAKIRSWMVGKIKTGANFKGVLLYNEKEQAEIIDKNMAGDTAQELTKEFLLAQELNPRVEKPVKHHIISFGPDDKAKLDSKTLQDITQDYLDRFGYSNNQYVSYLHQDTANPHLHIIVNKVDMDGRNTHLKLEKKRARKILMELERDYGMEPTRKHNPEKDAYDKTYRDTQNRLHRQKALKTDKERIHTAIGDALEQQPISQDDFARKLKPSGVELIKKGGGFKFAYKGREYKASTIHREFSYKKLNKIFESNNNERLKAAERLHSKPEPEKKNKKKKKPPKQQPRESIIIQIEPPKHTIMADQTPQQKQFNEKMQDLAKQFAQDVTAGKADYDAFIKKLADHFEQAKQLGYGHNFRNFSTDIMQMISLHVSERTSDSDTYYGFHHSFERAQLDYEQHQEAKKMEKRENELLKKQRNQGKDKGKGPGLSM